MLESKFFQSSLAILEEHHSLASDLISLVTCCPLRIFGPVSPRPQDCQQSYSNQWLELFYQFALHLPSTSDLLTFSLTHSPLSSSAACPPSPYRRFFVPFFSSTRCLFQRRQHEKHSVKIRRPSHRNFEHIIIDPAVFSVTFPRRPAKI